MLKSRCGEAAPPPCPLLTLILSQSLLIALDLGALDSKLNYGDWLKLQLDFIFYRWGDFEMAVALHFGNTINYSPRKA